MSVQKTLEERAKEKQKNGIDFSDIPELTKEDFDLMYSKNFKPRKQAVSIRIDMDTLEWLKSPDEKGYQKRLNDVLRWARAMGCPICNQK